MNTICFHVVFIVFMYEKTVSNAATDDATSLAWPHMLPALYVRKDCNWSEGARVKCGCHLHMPHSQSLKRCDVAYISKTDLFRATDDAGLAWPHMLPALYVVRQDCNWSEGGACKSVDATCACRILTSLKRTISRVFLTDLFDFFQSD